MLDARAVGAAPRERQGTGLVTQGLLALLGVIGAASLLAFVWTYGTNVPIGDDWDLLRTLVSWRTDGATVASLLAFHNEHRIVATRLIEGWLLPLIQGNLRLMMACNALFVVATVVVLFSFIRRETAHPLFLVFAYAAAVSLAVGWFQWQNLLWSFQLPWLLLPLLVVSSVWVLSFVRSNALCGLLAAALFAIALACQANGVLVLFASIPAVIARLRGRSLRTRLIVAGGLVLLAFAATALYFVDLPSYVVRPSVTAPLADPLRFAHFFLAVLGSPFSAALAVLGPERWVGVTAGSIGVVAAFLVLAVAWKTGRSMQGRAIFVLGLALLVFASGSVFAISLGRFIRFSPDIIESRYTTFALYFYVGIVLSFYSIIAQDLPTGNRTGLLRTAFLLVCVVVIVGSTWGDTLFARMGTNLKLAQLRYKASLNLSKALPDRPELVGQAHTVPPAQLQELLASLENQHLWVPGRITTLEPGALQTVEVVGNVDEVVDGGDRMILRGWTRLPDGLPADAVVAMKPDAANALVPVAMSSNERIARPDLVVKFGASTVLGSGWSMELRKVDFPQLPVLAAYSASRNVYFAIPFQSNAFVPPPR